jgi:hypothetical protein
MPIHLLGNPPVREEIVENNKPSHAFARWLSSVTAKLLQADSSANSTVSVTSADATDLPSAITLANELKADVNTLVTDINDLKTKLRAAGQIGP